MKKIIKNIGELVTCDEKLNNHQLGLLEDAAILIEDNEIKDIGRSEKSKKWNKNDCKLIDARGCSVLPGFIDPHTHFVFGGYRAEEFSWRLKGVSYVEIMKRGGGIVNTVESTRDASFSDLKSVSKKRLDSMLSFGVTTVEGKTGYGLNTETELKQLRVMKELDREHPLDVVASFMGAHAVPNEYNNNKESFINLITNEMLPAIKEEGGAEFCDIFCDEGAFTVDESRRILKKSAELGFKLKIHADEISSVGAAELAAELKAISAEHLLKVSDKGISELASKGVVPVLLPMTAFNLKEEYAPARKMIEAGLDVALATDLNPGSCYSESIPLLLALSTLYMGLTPEEAVKGITINAARAIAREDEIGSIRPGKKADLVILNAPSYNFLTYHLGVSSVDKVIKNGELVYESQGVIYNEIC